MKEPHRSLVKGYVRLFLQDVFCGIYVMRYCPRRVMGDCMR